MAEEKVLYSYEFLNPDCPFKSFGVTNKTLKKILESGTVHLSFSDFSVELKNIRSPGMKASGRSYGWGLENKKKPRRINKN